MDDALGEELGAADEYTLTTFLSWASSLAMIFGGVVPYIPQYAEIRRTENAEGFSLYVCFALLIANTLRILFWFGRGFELPLLIQSVIMNIAMLAMIKLCVDVKNKTLITKVSKDRHFTDFDLNFFWQWTDFQSYLECMLFVAAVGSASLYIFSPSYWFVEGLGLFAVLSESLLGVPQLLRNFKQKSTEGMSVKMVLMWTSGDTFKTCYFIVKKVPKQFPAGAIMQVIVDILIMGQVYFYRGKARHAVRQE
ncbi:solute carrier family 66 member 2 isoform X2 [Neocloeon triangulifer]|uniref:solute carrier family 66 member 2 isoform X2 n=1 Tax=Neocloeon triangulifer TaxID=2078957 RepID=UPI00286F14B3|nr:solute carrier family 66 member 2 isoform X2 [Neocloeon triangulifer]